jgi:hypothetical protein
MVRMIDERWILTNLLGAGCGVIDIVSWYLPGVAGKSHVNPNTIAGVPTEIRTDHLWNAGVERRRYGNVFATKFLNVEAV